MLSIRVTPRSSRNEVLGMVDGLLRVRLTAPPVDNAANDALVKALSDYFDVPKSSVTIVSGGTSKMKRVVIAGTTASDVEKRISST